MGLFGVKGLGGFGSFGVWGLRFRRLALGLTGLGFRAQGEVKKVEFGVLE